MREIYKDYEVFLTASTFETLGLSILEAISSGTAVIGLNVRYGSRLLVRPGENGYLIDFDPGSSEEEKIVDRIAEKMVDIFTDQERLERFHEHSYDISSQFMVQEVGDSWKRLIQEVLFRDKGMSESLKARNMSYNIMRAHRHRQGDFSHSWWKRRR